MRTRILIDGEWVDGQPAIGEWYQKEVGASNSGQIIWSEQHYYEPTTNIIDITVTSIDNTIQTTENFSSTIVEQGTVFTVNGTLSIPDRVFTLPIKNVNTGEVLFFTANVVNGEFSVKIQINNNSQYQYTNSECNLDLDENMFNVSPMKFNIVKTIEG